MKRFKPTERNARPNQVVQIQASITIKSQAANDKGAFQYQKSQSPSKQIRVTVGKGMYLGDRNCITAFVWDDDETETLKAA